MQIKYAQQHDHDYNYYDIHMQLYIEEQRKHKKYPFWQNKIAQR